MKINKVCLKNRNRFVQKFTWFDKNTTLIFHIFLHNIRSTN